MDRQHRVEQMREPDSLRFGDQPEQSAVPVERPCPALLDKLQPGLVFAVEKLGGDHAVELLVGEFYCLRTVPTNVDHLDRLIGVQAADGAARLEVFEAHRRTVPLTEPLCCERAHSVKLARPAHSAGQF